MSLGRFKDLCIDVGSPSVMTSFWGQVLGLTTPADNPEVLLGNRPEQTVWINRVLEARTLKQRVHLDVNTTSVEALERLGARLLSPVSEEQPWAVLADPEGGEFCGFVRDKVPEYRLMELVVDSADPAAQAAWWAGIVGGDVGQEPGKPYCWLENVPGLPFKYWVFVPVPEPKAVKNRIHWDITADDLDAVLAAGATLLRPKDDTIGWHVCADPEGNEFCVFLPDQTQSPAAEDSDGEA
ncbi:VOC family protein [Kribbella sp. CA-293567]|uniref:VOC family protein n=1 Tax=Kribbella sp. CA-293567 TaxID=3002436 RepID=UPI0022DE501D|nr:VOC family protein [Kribbella sp. CA-293567]WBQ06979.1 VOC family protein [Kribbella sp. CA-293567]